MGTQQSQLDIYTSAMEKETASISNDVSKEMHCIKMNEVHDSDSLKGITPSSNGEPSKIQPFPFMRLPLEIRNMVFKLVVIMPHAVRVAQYLPVYCTLHETDYTPASTIIPLFLVSRPFYREAGELYYHFNTFRFSGLDDLFALKTLAPDHRRTITEIDIDYVGRSPAKALSFLQTFIGLRRLRIRFWADHCRVPFDDTESFQPRQITGFKALAKTRGLEHLEVTMWHHDDDRVKNIIAQIEESLSCLKEPHDPTRIARLDKKDYPDKFHRSVFGNANVATRMEHKVMGTKPLPLEWNLI